MGCYSQPRLELLPSGSLLGPEEAIVAHLLEAVRRDMLEKATDELWGRQGGSLLLVGFPILIAKSDLAVLEFEEAVVA